ncbi:MAG: class I SAM-dependent methyltransferase [Lachnospiraceae bacterium]|nr:class I SAM-dependent methyltransferase [Lachnospiraceae bacterium]
MEAYSDFAYVYDLFMEDVPYKKWATKISGDLGSYGVTAGDLVLDLGCGTGIFTRLLQDKGYDMIGVDNSADMLNVANRDSEGILYLMQDMREFELYGTVKAVVSVCDSINYITAGDELISCFALVNNYLDPGGIFIFDFNTVHKYRDVIGDATIAENRPEASFIWMNYYDEDSHINEYDLTFFIKEGELYRKHDETHVQRGYELDEMKAFVAMSGLTFIKAVDADTGEEPDENSERIYIYARECGKERL